MITIDGGTGTILHNGTSINSGNVIQVQKVKVSTTSSISTDSEFNRPTVWRKQTEDMIIDGLKISKERNYLEPKISPTSGIIKSVSPSDGKIYVKDSWSFHEVDGLEQNQNDITIVSLGSTQHEYSPVFET